MRHENPSPAVEYPDEITRAIEEGKNKVTLLEGETNRLMRLNGRLQAEAAALEERIGKLEEKVGMAEERRKEAERVSAEAERRRNHVSGDVRDAERRLKEAIEREAAANLAALERERLADVKEREVERRQELLRDRERIFVEKESALARRVSIIEEAAKKLTE